MTKNLLMASKKYYDNMVELRRSFHMHPELGMEETRTAGIVAEELEKLGIEIETGVGGTGVVGVLRGNKQGKTIAIRADMDALPIEDRKNVDYASKVEGKMHACGHDGHTAILLGTAMLLSEMRGRINGTVKFIFQPAEEGPGGAAPMIKDGAMKDPEVDAIIGLHLFTDMPTGKIGIRYGATNAATDSFEIKIAGSGGHGAAPHRAVDAITMSAQVVSALQTIVSREINPLDSAVLTIGTIKGGYRYNVICPEVELTGTVRTLRPETRDLMPKRIEEILEGIVGGMRGSFEFRYHHGYPQVVNDERTVDLVANSARELLGDDGVVTIPEASMGGEDFSYFAQVAPGCFFRLGAGNVSKGCNYPGHHPMYNFDEDAMPVGVAVFANVVFNYLGD